MYLENLLNFRRLVHQKNEYFVSIIKLWERCIMYQSISIFVCEIFKSDFPGFFSQMFSRTTSCYTCSTLLTNSTMLFFFSNKPWPLRPMRASKINISNYLKLFYNDICLFKRPTTSLYLVLTYRTYNMHVQIIYK